MRRLLTLSLLGFLLITTSSPAEASVDREDYAKSVYQMLSTLLPVLIENDQLHDESAAVFLKSMKDVLEVYQPELIFVDDNEQFKINTDEPARLMRTVDKKYSPIFVNRTLLNSDGLELRLPQLIKLYLHELGRKTQFDDLVARDQWAQKIEDAIAAFYLSSHSNPSESTAERRDVLEILSLPPEMIQTPIATGYAEVQPTFWIYQHPPKNEPEARVLDLTPGLQQTANDNSVLTRNLGIEITMMITEVMNWFTTAIRENIGNAMQSFSRSFDEPGAPPSDFLKKQLPEGVKAMLVIGVHHISQTDEEFIIEASQNYVRSHRSKVSINTDGLPFDDAGERFAVVFKISKSRTTESPRITMQMSGAPNFQKLAKVGRVSRQGGRLSTLEISFDHLEVPAFADLILQYPGGSMRLRSHDNQLKKGQSYRSTFSFDSAPSQLASYVDRIILNNEEVILLDRIIEIHESEMNLNDVQRGSTPGMMSSLDVLPESIGVWGLRKNEHELGKSFSHLNHPILFFMTFPEAEQFVINPYNLWIEFEVRKEIDILQAELFWSGLQTVIDTTDHKKNILKINHQDEALGVTTEERYAGEGKKILEQRTLREMILFDHALIQERVGTRPGYKRVRMKSMSPLKNLRPLRNEDEAYGLPGVTPIGVRILDKQLRSFDFAFPADSMTRDLKGSDVTINCQEALKPKSK